MKPKHPFLRLSPKEQIAAAKKQAKKYAEIKAQNFFIEFVFQNTGLVLVAEHKPFSDRRHRIDFANVDLKIAIEKEGGVRMKGGGAHSRPENIERDIYKYTRLSVEGWIVIRRQPKQMNTVETITLIKEALKTLEKH